MKGRIILSDAWEMQKDVHERRWERGREGGRMGGRETDSPRLLSLRELRGSKHNG